LSPEKNRKGHHHYWPCEIAHQRIYETHPAHGETL
jgi:hypothetical protein